GCQLPLDVETPLLGVGHRTGANQRVERLTERRTQAQRAAAWPGNPGGEWIAQFPYRCDAVHRTEERRPRAEARVRRALIPRVLNRRVSDAVAAAQDSLR